MKKLTNQILWECDYCAKRLLTKKGAKIHENKYCWHEDSPNKIATKHKRLNCEHKNAEMQYTYIHGEAVQEPAGMMCLDCGSGVGA